MFSNLQFCKRLVFVFLFMKVNKDRKIMKVETDKGLAWQGWVTFDKMIMN